MFFKDRDPYATLGVLPTADPDEIRSAYRSLARRYHPDAASSEQARQRMIEVNRAWEVLGDPTRRADYDRTRDRSPVRDVPPAGSSPPGAAVTPDSSAHQPAWMARHATGRRPANGWGAGAKGRPPGNPSGSVLDFGIYLGWSLGEIARVDPLYLDWLAARPEGRRYADEIAALRARSGPLAGTRRWSFG